MYICDQIICSKQKNYKVSEKFEKLVLYWSKVQFEVCYSLLSRKRKKNCIHDEVEYEVVDLKKNISKLEIKNVFTTKTFSQ